MVPGSMDGMMEEKKPIGSQDIDALLQQLKEEGEQYIKNEKNDNFDVDKMMDDINNEFDELDNLLREVDEIKMQQTEAELNDS